MKQNPVRSLSRPSIVGFAKHQALTTRQQRHRHEFVRHSWKAKKAFQPEKSRKILRQGYSQTRIFSDQNILRRGCCWGFSSSAPPDSSRPPPSSSSPLEASASPPPPRTQAGRPGNGWKCNQIYLNWLLQISQLLVVILLPRGEVWDHYARPRHRRAAAGGEQTHKATWLRDRWPRRSALRELCCGGTERWLKLFLISRTKNRMIIFWMIQALMRYFWWRTVLPGRQQ